MEERVIQVVILARRLEISVGQEDEHQPAWEVGRV
jgi:hypothetical protein